MREDETVDKKEKVLLEHFKKITSQRTLTHNRNLFLKKKNSMQ